MNSVCSQFEIGVQLYGFRLGQAVPEIKRNCDRPLPVVELPLYVSVNGVLRG
jgi:hypothetical protein